MQTVKPGAAPLTSLPLRAGAGLKSGHFQHVLDHQPNIGFFEVHAENYRVAGGPFHHYLSRIRENYPLSLHGVTLSIGTDELLDADHLNALKHLLDRYQPESFSEHLAWSTHGETFVTRFTGCAIERACRAEHL